MNTPVPEMNTPAPKPSRRFGLGALIVTALFAAGAAGLAVKLVSPSGATSGDDHGHADADAIYQCPMHPSIVQDHPGDCPICGMKLVKVDKAKVQADTKAKSEAAGDRKVLFYRSPMDPKQTSPVPAKDEMGMDYLPVYADESAGPSAVEGLAAVEIDPDRQQLIGLKTTETSVGPVGGAWRTVGRVAIDETKVRHVNLKVPGFVEKIYVDFVGKKVRKGDPLFSIYSPELLAAQEEYLLALRTRSALANAKSDLSEDGDTLVSAARRKLSLWDVPQAEIDRITRTREPTKTLTFTSPASGVVTKKDAVEGMKLDAGAMPYEIVDLSSVWVLADVYESELSRVREGMEARLKLNAYPNREFKGKVVFIDPLLDPQTRTVKVRLTFPNPTGDLRPEMFGEVVLLGNAREGLRVPQDAVIDSGRQKVVFVALGEGKFQPRVVELGDGDGVFVEVLEGLQAADRVVTRANFLIDSESRLRASLADVTTARRDGDGPESARVLPGATAGAQENTVPPPTNHENHTGHGAPMPPSSHRAHEGHQVH